MNNPLGVSPSKGKQGTTRGKENIYTWELILCSIICVPSATRHNIHMYPYFLFAAIHHRLIEPMNNPLGVSPSKGNNGRSNPEVVGSIPTEVKTFLLYLVWLPDSLY